MSQRILGLDLGAHAVKAVLVESSYRGFAVAGATVRPLPPPDPAEPAAPLRDRQAAAVAALLAERGWAPDQTLVAFPGASASSHLVTLPFTDPRRIEQTVGFEVEGQIPWDLAEAAWDWQRLGERAGRADLLVAVARKEEVAGLLAALGGAGLDPRAVIPAGPALASLATAGVLPAAGAAAPEAEGEGEVVLAPAPAGAEVILDLGHERTSLCVVGPAGCEAARTFGFGARELARAAPDGEEAIARALAPLLREVRATLRAWRARVGQRPVTRLHVAGGLADEPRLLAALAAEVEGPVAPLALSGPAAAEIRGRDAPALALALALALRGHLGGRGPRLNLRRGELAYTRDFEHLKGKVARLAAYAALVLLLAVASAGVKAFALARQERALDRALCEAQEQILGRCYDNFEQAEAILRGRGPAGEAALPRASAVDLLGELSQRAPADVPVRLDRIEITREKLHLQGTTTAAENVDRLVQALKGSRCFGDARSGGARRRASDGKFEFSVDSALTCLETGVQPPAGERG
jgi:general secretion pathway protein L